MKPVFKRMTMAAAMVACCAVAATAHAAYPEQPVRMIVPFAPGGPTDLAARIVANAMGKTAVVGIPAILLEVVDLTDPVEVGKETTYVITATNQGTAMDTNIRIVTDLESSMQLVSAGGATEAASTGGRVTFAPLPKLEPGAKAEWRVTGKAVAPADSRFTTIMTTDELQRPVMETEATTLYK